MKILINALALKNPIKGSGGSARHLEEFLGSIDRVSSNHEYILCLDKEFADLNRFSFPSCKTIAFSIKSLPNRVWIDQIILPELIRKERCLFLFSLLTFGILRPPVPQTLFVRTPIYFSKRYIHSIPLGQRLALNARRKWLELGIQASKFIIVPSQAMKDSILEMNDKLPSERFLVIPHGFDKDRFLKTLNSTLQNLSPKKGEECSNISFIVKCWNYSRN